MDITLTYIFLALIMYLVALANGEKFAETKGTLTLRRTFMKLLPFIIVFTLNEGLRFGRGIDYNGYVDIYRDLLRDRDLEYEPMYTFVIWLFHQFDLPYQAFVAYMSFILCLGIAAFARVERSAAAWYLPLAIFLSIIAENLMRWFTAFGFILMALSFFLSMDEKNRKRNLIWFSGLTLCALLNHKGIIFVIAFIYPLLLVRKKMLSPYICVAVYGFLVVFFKTGIGEHLMDLVQLVSLGDHFEGYVDNADIWLTGSGGGWKKPDPYFTPTYTLFYFFFLFGGYYLIRKERNPAIVYCYNVFALAIMTFPLMNPVEIAQRINICVMFFSSMVGGYTLIQVWRQRRSIPVIVQVIAVVCMLNWARMVFINPLSQNPQQLLYVWDANGRDSLDVDAVFRSEWELEQ